MYFRNVIFAKKSLSRFSLSLDSLSHSLDSLSHSHSHYPSPSLSLTHTHTLSHSLFSPSRLCVHVRSDDARERERERDGHRNANAAVRLQRVCILFPPGSCYIYARHLLWYIKKYTKKDEHLLCGRFGFDARGY